MSITPGSTVWKSIFQLSPIILVDGIASGWPTWNGMPIMYLTEMINFPLGALAPTAHNIELDNFFANWRPVPGTELISQEVAKYPFATQQVAANAVIVQPMTISMMFDAPARGPLSYIAKHFIMTLLRDKLYEHNNSGGLYHVLTPSYIYENCVMKSFKDVSSSYGKQVQTSWQMDFEKPLITIDEADKKLNRLFDLLNKQAPVKNPTPSGISTGTPPPAQWGGFAGPLT